MYLSFAVFLAKFYWISEECAQRLLTRNLIFFCIADNDLDILFLVDSSTFVDNCPEIQNGTKGPITSQYISAETTPHYFRMKTFMKEYVQVYFEFDALC